MQIDVKLDFFTSFPIEKIKQFMDCLKEVEDGRMTHGKIELSISPGDNGKPQVSRVSQTKYFDK